MGVPTDREIAGPALRQVLGPEALGIASEHRTTTPAAYWARVDQLGFGAGPVPGFTNGPPLGNIPSMPMGPDGGAARPPGLPSFSRRRSLEIPFA